MINIKGYRVVEIDKDYLSLMDIAKTIHTRKPEWLTEQKDYFISSHILAVMVGVKILGFLRFSIQQIGIEKNLPAIIFTDKVLTEAVVLTFGVVEKYRNQGIGRMLQNEAMKLAKAKGCYQLRSKSAFRRSKENYHLKISLGFGIQVHHKEQSVYFVKAL